MTTEQQKVSLRGLIRATGGKPYFVRRTALTQEAALRYLTQSKSPRAPALLVSITARSEHA